MANFTIRPARTTDILQLATFLAPFVEAERLLPRPQSELRQSYGQFLIAEMTGALVGCVALEIYSQKLAELRSLAVAPQRRGQGIGQALVEACLARARAARVQEVLVVSSREGFFRQCGFDFTLPGEKKALFYDVLAD